MRTLSRSFQFLVLFVWVFCGNQTDSQAAGAMGEFADMDCNRLGAFFARLGSYGQNERYAGKNPGAYLSGRYSHKGNDYFQTFRGKVLRWESVYALRCMIGAYERSGGKRVRVISGLRNFDAQKGIWDGKFTGKRPGYKDCPKMNVTACARKILRFSSMPGTSRHHWGTDVDLADLTNGYFSQGEGAKFYKWMRQNAAKFGFCQPYTAGRNLKQGGYQEERWHWSFRPLASGYLSDWNALYGNQAITGFGGSTGKKQITGLNVLQNTYVNNINPQCK